MKRKTFYGFLFLLIIAVAGCGKKPSVEKQILLESYNNDVDTATVTKNDIYSTDVYQAEIIPYIEELSFQAEGILDDVYIKIGSKVKKGDALAKLKNSTKEKISEYSMKKNELYAAYLYESATLQNNIKVAELTGKDTEELQLSLKHTNELFQLKNSQIEKKLNELKEMLTATPIITAPFDGEIVAISTTEIGGYVGKGASFLAIASEDKKQVACDFIAERNIKNMYRCYAIIDGKEYDLEYLAYSQEEISKKIQEKIVNQLSYIGLVSKFELKKPDSSVKTGSYATVCVVKGFKENALTVPVNAVYSEASKKYVFQDVNGSRVKTPVKVGLTDNMNTEILSGIKEGATVYVND